MIGYCIEYSELLIIEIVGSVKKGPEGSPCLESNIEAAIWP